MRRERIYDISQPIQPGVAVWPGDTPYAHTWNLRLEEGHAVNLSDIRLSLHAGTHADAPLHFLSHGAGIDQVDLDKYIGPARVVRVTPGDRVRREDLEQWDWGRIPRCLLQTGSCSHPCRFDQQWVPVSEEAARYLVDRGISLLGTDAPSVDDFASKDLPAHHILGDGQVAILENLYLAEVPEGEYELIALPLRVVGADASPVRAILRPLRK